MFDHLPKSYAERARIVVSEKLKKRLLFAYCVSASDEEFVKFVDDALFSYFARWNFFKQRSFPYYVLKGELKSAEFGENVADGILFFGERDASPGDWAIDVFVPNFISNDDFVCFIEEHRDLRVAMGCALYDFENFLFFASHYRDIGFVSSSGREFSGGDPEKLRSSARVEKWLVAMRIKSVYAGLPLVCLN